MARIRTIKPEFWRHEDLSALPESTHMLAAALLNYADDEGYFNANPKLIQSECFPLREPSVSLHDSLSALVQIGYLRLGTTKDGKTYGHILHFLDHQRVSHPTPSKISGLQIVWEDSAKPHGGLTEASALKGKEGKGKEDRGASALSFAGKIIRLKESDHLLWKQSFLHIDVDAALASRDAYLSETEDLTARKNWFVSTAAWLRNKNEEAKSKPKTAAPTVSAPRKFKPEPEIVKPPEAERAAQVDRLLKRTARELSAPPNRR